MRHLPFALLLVVPLPAAGQTLVVAHKAANTVGVYDAAEGTTLAEWPTGAGPHEVAVSGDGRWAVVTDYGAAGPGGTTLTVLDLTTGEPGAKISLPYARPHGAQFLADHRTVAVTAERDARVLLVDVATGRVTRELETRQRASHMVAISPDNTTAYTANISDGSLSIIPIDGGEVRVVPVGTLTEAIAASPDGRTVWLGSNDTGKGFVVDVAEGRVVDSVQTAGFPYRIAFTPDGKTAIVTNPEADEVRLIDAATREITAVIAVAGQPMGLHTARDNRRAWVTLGRGAAIAELLLPEARVERRFPTGAGPDGIGVAY